MSEWQKTGCVLCAQNCGLEVKVENNRITKVKPDRDNPRSQGYVCRKGLNVMYHQYPEDRLTEPLKRVGDRFEPIPWGEAIGEIADKIKSLVGAHGPRCLAYMGGGLTRRALRGGIRIESSPLHGLPVLLFVGRAGIQRFMVGVRQDAGKAV